MISELVSKLKSMVYLQPEDLKHPLEVSLMDVIDSIAYSQRDNYTIFINRKTLYHIEQMTSFVQSYQFLPTWDTQSDVTGMIYGVLIKSDNRLSNGIIEIRGQDEVYTISADESRG